ncbi:DUF1722 domain-containing protein [Nocardiopsis aegyptia]|uniref:DUF1722 domain-containing protein n=1 Tax=Nocardiopsis aegyptia TaxID=220378 RepID=UPI0036717EFB
MSDPRATFRPAPARPVVGVSSCLPGAPVRYNGGHSRPRFLTDELGRHADGYVLKNKSPSCGPLALPVFDDIVAAVGDTAPAETARAYTSAFHATMAVRTSRGKHANALQHAFGMLSPLLDDTRRHDLLEAIEAYRVGEAPLSLPVALLRHHCAAEDVVWAREQTYLRPYPDDLRLRHPVDV